MKHYTYIVKWSDEEGSYIAQIEGKTWATHGDSPVEALIELQEVEELGGLIECGNPWRECTGCSATDCPIWGDPS